MNAQRICSLVFAIMLAMTIPAWSLNIPPTLRDELTGNYINYNTRNLVICIHGWNNPVNPDRYTEPEWAALVSGLKSALPQTGSDPWALLLYHWEDDAATGLIDWNVLEENPAINARDASRFAWDHGISLGSRLPSELRRVHIIAHSAGAWAAYQTAITLLNNNPFVVIQVTLLDPYIPDVVLPDPYTALLINGLILADFLGGEVSLLENYFADDSIPGVLAAPTLGTQETFPWRSQDINRQVEWDPNSIHPPGEYMYYDWHSGPIRFYSDTIQAVAGSLPSRLPPAGNPYDYHQFGWYRSLSYRTQQGELPKIITQPIGQDSTDSSVTLSVSASGLAQFDYQWFRNGHLIFEATDATYTVNSSADPPTSYVVQVHSANGSIFSDSAVVTFYSAPATPTITSVSPSTLPTSASQQRIKIIGSGFTGSSILLFNGTISSDPTRLHYVNANEIDYDIIVASAGSWSVKVITGSHESNSKTFTVITPPPGTGSLVVNLSPAGANSAGAQWQVNGTYYNSGNVIPALAPGQYTVSFKTVSGYTSPASFKVNIVANAQTTTNATYTAVTATTYYLGVNSDPSKGSVYRNPNRNTFTPGETVRLTANNASGWHFDYWSGDASGNSTYVDVVMNSDKTVTANWASGDWSVGAINVTIQPSGAVAAGARWKTDGGDWQDSGVTFNNAYLGDHYLQFSGIAGWTEPAPQFATVTGGQTTNVVVTYTQNNTPGTLIVTLMPSEAVAAGVKWRVNGGSPQNSSAVVSLPPTGYTVSFDGVNGWNAPGSQTVSVQPGQTTLAVGNYTPPVGQPVIVTVRPPIGSLTGGTALTIDGVNFTVPATVLIGGKPATNVTVLDASQIICFTPSNSVYGTVPIIVQTAGGSATNQNGFTYGIPRGSGIELAGSIGGLANAVAVQGNYCYLGEGSSLVILNVANPTSPSIVGRLAMPGIIRDMAFFSGPTNSYLCVADNDAGLQIVDVTNPSTPLARGQYLTGDPSLGVTVQGLLAYAAIAIGGLAVFDLSEPTRPQFLSSIATGGYADKVAVRSSTNGVLAYVSSNGGLSIVDVSDPANPALRGQSASVSEWWLPHSLAIAGNRLFIADWFHELLSFDITNPDSPVYIGTYGTEGAVSGVASIGNRVYLKRSGAGFGVADLVGGNLQRIGAVSTGPSAHGNNVALSNGRAFCAGEELGLSIYDAATPSSPTFRASLDATTGAYRSISLNNTDVYVASQNSGMKVLDTSNPANPALRSVFMPASGGGEKVEFLSNRAYFLGYDGQMRILDVANPSGPVLLGTTSQNQFSILDFYMLGSYIVAWGRDSTYRLSLAILNPNPPSATTIRGQLLVDSPNGLVKAICGNASIACLAVPNAEGNCSLRVISVSNTQNPQQVGQLADIGNIRSLRLAPDNRYLYAGTWGRGNWKIIDLLNVSTPVLISSNFVDSSVAGFDIVGTTAVVAASGKGIMVYDVSDPSQPQLIRSYGTTTPAYDVKISEDTVYVAGFDGGLTILKLPDIEAPEVFITSPTFSPTHTNITGTLNLGGGAPDGGVTRVTWANSRGGGGNAAGTDSWFVSSIPLQPGTNILTVTAFDLAGNSGTDTITVIYQTPKQSQAITFPALADKTFDDPPFVLSGWTDSGLPVSFSIVSGPAIVSSNMVTIMGVGTVMVRANQSGDVSFNAAANVDQSFNVSKGGQVITFSAIPDKQIGDLPFSVTAASSVGLPVTFSVISGPASISSNIVTITGAGIVTINASQTGNTNFNAAHADRSFTVAKIPQVITFSALSRQVFGDAPFALSATASSGLDVEFSVLSGPAIVNGNILTLTGPKIVVLRASQPGDAIYAPAPNIDQILIVDGIGPSIAVQPVSQTVFVGTNTMFAVVASGNEPLGYQWRKNGVSILGATNSSHAISNVQTNHAGNYSVVVANSTGSVTSSNAVLKVVVRPVILTQPQSRTLIAGTNVLLAVVALDGNLKYQWRFKGTNLTGATKASYSITNVQPRHAGSYSVIVSNLAGSVTSSNAVLTVKLLLTATAVGNGSVSPTNVLVNPGSTQSFKAIAFTNYTVGEWYLGGVRKQTGGTNYTLYNIQTNHAVKVVFRPIIKLYWQHTNGLNSEWRFNGTNYLTSAGLPSINPAWQMVGQSDFNSDNSMDLLFQNTDGRLLLRTMRGTSLIRENLVRSGQAAPVGWKLKALSDLNNDVQTDFLFQTSTNRLTTWFMSKGTNFLSSTLMQSHESGWRVVGMADFNADKKNDILWQNSAGYVSVWFMNGRTNTAKVNLREGKAAAAGWNISALADLDFNGQKDILLQNSKGQVAVWLMNRTNYLGSVLLRNGQTNAPGWQLKGPK